MSEPSELKGPDLALGYAFSQLRDGEMLLGHAEGEAVLLARRGEEVFAVGATCTHYNGPLHEGLMVGDTVRCPWHHACFSLRSGEAVAAPALHALPCWEVIRKGDRINLGARKAAPTVAAPSTTPKAILIVGAGAAGVAAAYALRKQGYKGALTMISADDNLPVDRPNLSKDYLAGSMPEDWLWLLPDSYYVEHDIQLIQGVSVKSIDTAHRVVAMADGRSISFDALLLATGAEPIPLTITGADLAHVHYLRSLKQSQGIVAAAAKAKRVCIIGASFIGLEAAASLRKRGLEVHVVAPGARPLEKILGAEVGDLVRTLHEEQGVIFHFNNKPSAITQEAVTLENGERIAADLVVVGIGVRPLITLAEAAGLTTDKGVVVDQYLQTSAEHIYAAGDVARYPLAQTGEHVRIEHWVVAERQGQAVARNLLGQRVPYTDVPFFWSAHYDVTLNYVGHAEHWDKIEIDGSLAARDCIVRYSANGKILAVLTIARDLASLEAEVALATK